MEKRYLNDYYEERGRIGWVAPVIGIISIVILGLLYIRPEKTAPMDDFRGEAGIGGGPPQVQEVVPSKWMSPSPTPGHTLTPDVE